MFRPSCRSSSPFSLTDLDMWDTKSRFTAQTSAWCGMATVSGTGFLSKVSTSTSGSTGGFRQNDPGLRKWQSLSHLAPVGVTRSFPPCPGAELRAAQGESSFRQAEVVQCLQDAHERLDTQLDRLSTRNSQLSYNITTAKLLDMKHKLSEAMSALEQEKEAAELSQFEKSRQRGKLHEKVLKLEKDLQQMRSTLDRGGNDQPTENTPGSLSRSLPMSQEDFYRESQKFDTELYKLREALREVEAKAKAQEEERNQALQKLQTSTETQRMLLNQIEEMNQTLSHTRQNHFEVQEQLSEANNKLSQAYLEKAILSTQVLKLEDDIKELKAKLTGPLSDKDHLIQENADLHQRVQVLELELKRAQQGSEGCEVLVIQSQNNNKQDQETVLMKDESKTLREVNEELTCELEMIKQNLKTSRSQLQEITAERVTNSKQITVLKAECTQLIREKEELLLKMNEGRHECCQLRESVEVLELEKLKLQDQCVSLEAEVLEKEEKLHVQEQEYRKQDAMRVQSIRELQAVATHWTEKWQKVALTLQSTQEELEELKKSNSSNEKESDSLLSVELDACKQELELERSRSQVLLHRYKGGEAVQTRDKQTVTDLSESSLLWETPSDSQSSQNKSPQQKLTEREKKLREKEEALKSLERLRETEQNEAQLKISALELKASEDGSQAEVSTTNSLRAQLEESRRRANELQQEKTLAAQKIQTFRQLYPVKDEKPPVEGRKDKTVCPVILETDQQRRMVTEQLKSLFKEREGKEVGKIDNRSAAAQTGASSLQDWTPASKVKRTAVDKRSWQQGSGLMPVFEEDEGSSDWPGGEEGKQAEEAHAEENINNQRQQMSMGAEISNLKAETVNLLKDGIYLAELVDMCSPDEDEEGGEDT